MNAEYLYSLVRDGKIGYDQIKQVEPKKFEDLEYTMRLIFNHEGQQKQWKSKKKRISRKKSKKLVKDSDDEEELNYDDDDVEIKPRKRS